MEDGSKYFYIYILCENLKEQLKIQYNLWSYYNTFI